MSKITTIVSDTKIDVSFFYDEKGNITKVEETFYAGGLAVAYGNYEFGRSGRSLEVTANFELANLTLFEKKFLAKGQGMKEQEYPVFSEQDQNAVYWKYELDANNCITGAAVSGLGLEMNSSYGYNDNRLVRAEIEDIETTYLWKEGNMAEVQTVFGKLELTYTRNQNKTNVNVLPLLSDYFRWSGEEMGGSYAQLFFYGGKKSLYFPGSETSSNGISRTYDFTYNSDGYPVGVEIKDGGETESITFEYV